MIFKYLQQVLQIRIFTENAHFRRRYFVTWSDFFVLNHSQHVSVWSQIFSPDIFNNQKKSYPMIFKYSPQVLRIIIFNDFRQ